MDTMYQERVEITRRAAEEAGFQVLVILSKGSRNLGQTSTHGNLRYLLDWTTWGSISVLFLPTEGKPVLIVPIPGDVEQAHETIPWLEDVRTGGGNNLGKILYDLLAEKKIKGRVGTIGFNEVTYPVYTDFHQPCQDWTLEEADLLLDRQRVVKDEFGLGKMKRAARCCDFMLAALAEALREPGIPAWKAQVIMENAGRLDGAEVVFSWFVTGPHPDHPRVRREENQRPIQVGDCVVAGIILIYEGYYGHTLRMLTVGEPAPAHRQLWQAVADAQQTAAALLKPGVGISQPNAAAEQVLFRHLPEARRTDKIRFRPCHFIGMDYAEYPTALISPDPAEQEAMVLQAGMTMEVHPNIRPPELGFGALGDVFVVTPQGGERLTAFPPEIFVVEPG
jgi:Xaa-Pro dipeptidase